MDMPTTKGHTAARLGEDIIAWRIGRLRSAGFDDERAQRLARDPRYDLHAVLGLVDRGCPPALAARILAPIDEAEHP
jgi:hypothetical protein